MRYRPARELLDEDAGSPEELRAAFKDLWRMNRWLGGLRTHKRLFRPVVAAFKPGESLWMLEVGAGTGQMAAVIRDWIRAKGVRAEAFVLDRLWSHLNYGNPRANSLHAVAADALTLPFADDTFDVISCSLFLHHFGGEQAVRLLRDMHRVTRKYVLINDIRRHWIPYIFVRIAGRLMLSRITRYDAPASFRQAYTRRELRDLLERAGLHNFEIRQTWPYRLSVTIRKKTLPTGQG